MSPREQGSERHLTHTEDYAGYFAELSQSFLKHFKSFMRDFVVNTEFWLLKHDTEALFTCLFFAVLLFSGYPFSFS